MRSDLLEDGGRFHREYLRMTNPGRLNELILTGNLWTYLADLNEQAGNRLSLIIQQMKEREGITKTAQGKESKGMG